MSNRVEINLQALITEREAWVTRRALYEARTAEGCIMEQRYFDEVEDALRGISNAISGLLSEKA